MSPETRRAEALTEIARRRTLAEAATPGPWAATRMGLRGGTIGVVVSSAVTRWFVLADRDHEARLEDGRHIAANDPVHVLAVLDAAEATLDRHVHDGDGECLWCTVGGGYPQRGLWPCPDAAAVLDLYAPVEGEQSA